MLHRLTATTALSACVFGSLLFSGVAEAKDPEHYFYPKNKWVVERVESTDGNELHSCTISNQLNNGYRVQIAGTANGFTNINLDLKQNVFEAGKRYEVVYQVPGVKKELLATRAFQQNLLVSDLRDKSEFVAAMRESGVLDISIRKNEFRVYMTGFDAKMQSFTQCVGGDIGMAKAPEAVATPEPTPSPEMAETPAPAETEITALDENTDLLAKPQQRQRYTETIEEEIKQGSSQYKPDEQSSAVLDEAPKAVQAKADIAPTPAVKPQPLKTGAAPAKKPFYEAKTSKHRANVDFTNQAAAVSAIQPASGSAAGKAVNHDYKELQADLTELQSEVRYLRNQNKMLDEELKLVVQEGRTERVSVETDNWNLERATMRFEEAERQALRLGRQLSAEQARCNMEKKDLETMLFDPQLTNQGQIAKLSALEQDLDKSQAELYRQQRKYEERIRLLEKQLNVQ